MAETEKWWHQYEAVPLEGEEVFFKQGGEPEMVPSEQALARRLSEDEQRIKQEDDLQAAREHVAGAFPGQILGEQIVTDLATPVERLIGMGERADELVRSSELTEQALREQEAGGVVPDILQSGFRGASRSLVSGLVTARLGGRLGGARFAAPSAIGGATVQEMNRSVTQGKDAGLEGADLAKYVAVQGAIEAIPASVMQRAGLGGFESLVARGPLSRGLKQGVIDAIKRTGQEIPEELVTEIGHNLESALAGVNPDAMSPEQLEQTALETVVQTTMMMGMGEAGAGVARGQQRANRLRQLQDIRRKRFISAEDAERIGLSEEDSKSRKTRGQAVDREIRQLQQEIDNAEEEVSEPTAESGQEPDDQAEVQPTGEEESQQPAEVRLEGQSLSAMTPAEVEQRWRQFVPGAPRIAPSKSEMIRDIQEVQDQIEPVESQGETEPAAPVYSEMAPSELTQLLKERQVPGRSKATSKAAKVELLEQHDQLESAAEQAEPEADPEFGRDVSGVVGIANTMPLGDQPGQIGKSLKNLAKKYFTAAGELPSEAYDAKVRKEGRVSKEMNQLRFAIADFRRGVTRALGGKELTQADLEQMNSVLRNEAEMSTVPESVRAPLQKMRDHIDSLSRQLIAEGVAQGDLVGIITENLGTYATRSYRVFDDPKWRRKVPAEVRNRAAAAIRQMDPRKTDQEIAGIIESLLFRGAADTPAALLTGSKLGSKDLSIFMKRQEVPPWLRDLWGEYKDPGVNYARSVFKMSHLLANQQFLNEVREAGLGRWLRTQEDGPIVNEYGEVITPIAAEGSSVMSPLNGLYTTPEIKRAFEEFDKPGSFPLWLRMGMSVNYAVKYGKTVGSMMTHIRNLISNAGFAVANGHWRLNKANRAAWTTATGAFGLSDQDYRDYYLRLAELGVVGEDVRAGELKDALRDANQGNIDEFLYNRDVRHAKKIARTGRASIRALNALYQAEDAVWKVYAFENEKARYGKAHPEWSETQVEEQAAKIVRDTYPTYSKIGQGVKALRRFPLVGTFVSFPAEVVRTTFNTVQLGFQELQTPGVRLIGAQRIVGTALSIGMLSVLSRAMMGMFGIDEDEDEDLRWFVPPWQENSRFVYTSPPEDGTYRFVDLGYSDPHAYLTDSLIAAMRGDSLSESVGNATAEFLRPFASEEILAGALMDLRSNEDQKIYNPRDEFGEQAKDMVTHLWNKALEPGTISSLRRINTAIQGTDPNKDVTTEVVAMTTGQRLQKVDVGHSLGFRVRDFGKALTEIQRIARKTATSRGTASGEMVATDLARMERLRLAEFAEMQQILGAARRLGVSEKTIQSMLTDELPDGVAEELLSGDYSPYQMTPQTVQQMLSAAPEEFRDRFAAWHGEKLPDAVETFARSIVGSLPTKQPETEPELAEYQRKFDSARTTLNALGVSHEQAQQLLAGYYDSKLGGIFDKSTSRRSDTKPSYQQRGKALAELYGLPEQAFWDWRSSGAEVGQPNR